MTIYSKELIYPTENPTMRYLWETQAWDMDENIFFKKIKNETLYFVNNNYFMVLGIKNLHN